MHKGKIDIPAVLTELGRREILSVLLEAGPSLNASALAAKAVDRLRLFYAPKIAGDARVPFVGGPPIDLPEAAHISSIRRFGADIAVEIELRPSGEL
jgi:diaminohydroxyphosphoribosylaminopyrimidine deaminase/5-amino-6-(5-phosphoribosylamino)uracil reductase